jgi:hypothetical protein
LVSIPGVEEIVVFLAQSFGHVSEVIWGSAFVIPGVRFIVVKARPVGSSHFKNAGCRGEFLSEFMRRHFGYLGLPFKLPRINAVTDVDLEVF